MADSPTMSAVPSDAMDEVELEEIDDTDTAFMTVPSRGPSVAPPTRSSMPPPIPEAARHSRPPSSPAPARISLPAPPPPARITVPPSVPPSSSGMFRIENARRASPVPPVPPPMAIEVVSLKAALEQERVQVQRLRLNLRMRDDRVQELERLLADANKRLGSVERTLEKPAQVADDLKRIRGIGPSFERGLREAGVTTFAQIAAFTPEDLERVAAKLSIVPQRILRDGWIERARELAVHA